MIMIGPFDVAGNAGCVYRNRSVHGVKQKHGVNRQRFDGERDLPHLGALCLTRLELVCEQVFGPLRAFYPEAAFTFNCARIEGLGYYPGLCLRISPIAPDGQRYPIIDGGFTNWTARLVGNRKERLLTSAIGSEFACRMCVQKRTGTGAVHQVPMNQRSRRSPLFACSLEPPRPRWRGKRERNPISPIRKSLISLSGKSCSSKVNPQFGDRLQHQQPSTPWPDLSLFEDPGAGMRDIDGI